METNKEYLARLLPLLKKEIPSQWRVQSFSKTKEIATVMSYIDQRDLMDVLDAYCEYGWEKYYEEVAGNVFCRIGIHMPDGTVHWRSDCGVESQSDAEKGRASDAAKRAGVNWGVGRFLYDKPIQYVTTNEKKVGNNYPYCVDEQGKRIYDLTTYINNKNPNAPKPPEAVQPKINHTATLQGAQTIENLASIWTAIPKAEQANYKAIKDEMKEILEQVKLIGEIKTLLKLDAYIAEFEQGKFKDNAKLKALLAKRQLELKG